MVTLFAVLPARRAAAIEALQALRSASPIVRQDRPGPAARRPRIVAIAGRTGGIDGHRSRRPYGDAGGLGDVAGDADLIGYFQRLCGYALVGVIICKCRPGGKLNAGFR